MKARSTASMSARVSITYHWPTGAAGAKDEGGDDGPQDRQADDLEEIQARPTIRPTAARVPAASRPLGAAAAQ